MKKIFAALLALTLMLTLLAGCSKANEETSSGQVSINIESETVSEEEPVSSEPEKVNLCINPFTGLRTLNESAVGARPYGLMINNIKEALPQWGISSPDMCYEFLVEGGITRILALFADPAEIPKIGPIRSARTYYISTVCGYDAIYAHFGASNSGNSLIRKLGINDLDGMYLSSTFVRDPERRKIRDIEHTYYTDGEKLIAATQKKNYRTNSNISNFSAFTFAGENEDITVNGNTKTATDISIVFSKYTNSDFKYNATDKLYYKSEFGNPHVDANNDAQVAVTNVIVINDKHTYEPENGICLILEQKSGTGYYCSGGKSIEIKWTKGDYGQPYNFTLADGSPLKVTPGKTWISVIRNTSKSKLTIS